MTPCAGSSSPRPRRPSRAPPSLARALVALLVLAGAAACVGRGTHQEVVRERDALAGEAKTLRERARLLEASNESLSGERVRLLEEVEALRIEREELAEAVAVLEAQRAELETSLAAREAELARQREEVERLRGTYDGLVEDLQSEIAEGRIQIQQLREGLSVNLAQEILFPSGSAELDPQGETILRKVASRLESLPHRVEVQGHTDDRPISGALAQRYPSNWELAGARAARVVRIFADAGLEPARLTAVSLGETRPVAPNDTPEGRARNRRIEIRLSPVPEAAEPAAAGYEGADPAS